jgi:hypothetical protein
MQRRERKQDWEEGGIRPRHSLAALANSTQCSETKIAHWRWPACRGKGVTLACLWEEGCDLGLDVGRVGPW